MDSTHPNPPSYQAAVKALNDASVTFLATRSSDAISGCGGLEAALAFFESHADHAMRALVAANVALVVAETLRADLDLRHLKAAFHSLNRICTSLLCWIFGSAETVRGLAKFGGKSLVEAIIAWNKKNRCSQTIKVLIWVPVSKYSVKSVTTGFKKVSPQAVDFPVPKSAALAKHAVPVASAAKILASLVVTANSTEEQYTGFPLAWFSNDLSGIVDDITEACPDAGSFLKEARYGSVLIKVPLALILPENCSFYQLGTREYLYEYSKVILVSESRSISFIDDKEEFHALKRIEISTDDPRWPTKLSYDSNGNWSHPEWVFTDNVSLDAANKARSLQISFLKHGARCINRDCSDCQSSLHEVNAARFAFVVACKQAGVNLNAFKYAFSGEDWVAMAVDTQPVETDDEENK